MTERFVEIQASKDILDAIKLAIVGDPSLVTGASGTGKTTALRHYVHKFDGVYCEVDETTKSPGGMYRMLIKAYFGVRRGRTMLDDAEQLYDAFDHRDRQRPLFVDEQQTFEATALRELLRVCERCNIPLILAGNAERLAKTKKTDSGALDQIRSRIGHRVQVGPPRPADCKSIAVDFNVEGMDTYAALANFGGRKNIRELVRLLRTARIVAGPVGSIQLRHVETALVNIENTRDALKLLTADARL